MKNILKGLSLIFCCVIILSGCGMNQQTDKRDALKERNADTVALELSAMPRSGGYMRSVIRDEGGIYYIASDGIRYIRNDGVESNAVVRCKGIAGMFISGAYLYYAYLYHEFMTGDYVKIARIRTSDSEGIPAPETEIVWDSAWPNAKTGMGRGGAGGYMIDDFCVFNGRLFVVGAGIYLGEVDLDDGTAIYQGKGDCFAIPDDEHYIQGYSNNLEYEVGDQGKRNTKDFIRLTEFFGDQYDTDDTKAEQSSYVGYGDSLYAVTERENIIWRFSKEMVCTRIEIPALTSGTPAEDFCLFHLDDAGRLWLLRCAHPEYELYRLNKDVTDAEFVRSFTADLHVQSYQIVDNDIFLSLNSEYKGLSAVNDYMAKKVIRLSVNGN